MPIHSLKKSNTTILEDIDDIAEWLDFRNQAIASGETVVVEAQMPVLAKVICGGKDSIALLEPANKKKYEKQWDKNKEELAALSLAPSVLDPNTKVSAATVATGVGAGSLLLGAAGIGSTAMGVAASSGLGLASLGAAAFVPALWPVGISMLAFGVGAFFKKSNNSKVKKPRCERLIKIFDHSKKESKKCADKINANNKKIHILMSQKIKATLETLRSTAKKAAINVDDMLNTDVNLRIMQYQEIVLQQYNSQNEIRKALADLIEAYETLTVENQKLANQVASYEANMKICACVCNWLERGGIS